MKKNLILKKPFKQIIFYLGLLLLWQAVIMLKLWPEYLFPGPAKVFTALFEGFGNHSFLIGMAVSFKRLLIGFGISIVLGSAIGTLLVKYKTLDETVGGLVLGLQTLPSICWFPLALLWFGLNEWSVIFVIIAGSVFSMTIATYSSFKNVPPIYIKVGRNMGAKNLKLLWNIFIPAAIPSLVSGLRQSWSFAWRSLMAGELLYNSLGLGFLLNTGRELNDMSQVIAVIFLIIAISILVDKMIFGRIESKIRARYGL